MNFSHLAMGNMVNGAIQYVYMIAHCAWIINTVYYKNLYCLYSIGFWSVWSWWLVMTPDWSTQSFECPGFFLLNEHLFNLPLALLSHFLLPRQLVFLDFWVATIFAVAYLHLAYFGSGAGASSLVLVVVPRSVRGRLPHWIISTSTSGWILATSPFFVASKKHWFFASPLIYI